MNSLAWGVLLGITSGDDYKEIPEFKALEAH